jgi:ABC-type sugar transport system ATPase subunit
MGAVAPIFSLRAVSKAHRAVQAVREVDLDVFAGDVLAICGDNGAGKSPLIELLTGAEQPTVGTMT